MCGAHSRAGALSREALIIDSKLFIADARYGFIQELGTSRARGRRRPGREPY